MISANCRTGDPDMKRIFLFIATNLAVMLVLSIVLSLLGIGRPGAAVR
jgi:hypothetical protein